MHCIECVINNVTILHLRCSLLYIVSGHKLCIYRGKKKAKWIERILCRNYTLKHVIEGKLEGRIKVKVRSIRPKHRLDDLRKRDDTGN